MVDTVIVALPAVDDKVYRISSEKVPHLTLCFLGDLSNSDALPGIVEYVQHAASELSPFGLPVSHRGTLGPDDADVLFFEDNQYDSKRIKEFRHYLLLDDAIKRAYDSQTQYPEWTPHLTLGYPATPAHEDTSDYPGIHYVNFDRIAVWMGDSTGPEFRLKYDDFVAEMAMSTSDLGAMAASAIFGGPAVEHHGVKGMKWGVRADKAQKQADKQKAYAQKRADIYNASRAKKGKAPVKVDTKFSARGDLLGRGYKEARAVDAARQADRLQKRADKKMAKADSKWEKSVYTVQGAVAVHNAMAEHFNSRIGALNDKHPDADYRKGEDTPEWKAYMADVNKLQSESYSHAVTSVHGTSPSGKKKAEYYNDGKGNERIVIHSAHLAHADVAEPDLILRVKTDEQGRIIEMNEAETELAHADTFQDFLEHYGVKGMKWGVTTVDKASSVTLTREKKALRNTKDVTVTQRKAGTYAKAKGGQRQKATDDAVKAVAARQKAKKSTTDSLSNAELKAAVERMQLEQSFAKLDAATKRKGQGFLSVLFSSPEARKVSADLLARANAENKK